MNLNLPKFSSGTRFLKLKKICENIQKNPSTVYRWINKGLFPAPVKLGPNSVAWRESDYEQWAADPEGWKK